MQTIVALYLSHLFYNCVKDGVDFSFYFPNPIQYNKDVTTTVSEWLVVPFIYLPIHNPFDHTLGLFPRKVIYMWFIMHKDRVLNVNHNHPSATDVQG